MPRAGLRHLLRATCRRPQAFGHGLITRLVDQEILMFCFRLFTSLSCFFLAALSLQAQQPANSFVVIEEDFNCTHLDAGWQNAEGWVSGTSLTNRFVSKADASGNRRFRSQDLEFILMMLIYGPNPGEFHKTSIHHIDLPPLVSTFKHSSC